MSLVLDVARFLLVYLGCAVFAFLLHLASGILSVGREEVARQVQEVNAQLAALEWVALVLTAGLYPPTLRKCVLDADEEGSQ